MLENNPTPTNISKLIDQYLPVGVPRFSSVELVDACVLLLAVECGHESETQYVRIAKRLMQNDDINEDESQDLSWAADLAMEWLNDSVVEFVGYQNGLFGRWVTT